MLQISRFEAAATAITKLACSTVQKQKEWFDGRIAESIHVKLHQSLTAIERRHCQLPSTHRSSGVIVMLHSGISSKTCAIVWSCRTPLTRAVMRFQAACPNVAACSLSWKRKKGYIASGSLLLSARNSGNCMMPQVSLQTQFMRGGWVGAWEARAGMPAAYAPMTSNAFWYVFGTDCSAGVLALASIDSDARSRYNALNSAWEEIRTAVSASQTSKTLQVLYLGQEAVVVHIQGLEYDCTAVHNRNIKARVLQLRCKRAKLTPDHVLV